MGTSVLGVTAAMVKRKFPDTDADDADIELEAQTVEDNVLDRLNLTSAPSPATAANSLALAVTLRTAAILEAREPHSRADGSVREDRFNRVTWTTDAEIIERRFERTFQRT